ncbi:MAG TPA: 2-oxoacid:ferredoxin oxidoreductase subunit beta [Planctomycetota bacterium]|nr:2-oxoacid:ferredoxin oxidoreductase subunit beta [Planctomycetota bacterium]
MSTPTTPAPAPAVPAGPKVNRLGLPVAEYQGARSTLCPGCGHDVVTNTLISALWEMGVEPHLVAKMSGIGCSSKTPNYFLNRSWGFNSVHGRMPTVATGALLANRTLRGIGVSGDGDTAAIGMGHFVHLLRRNVPMVYVCENNGVYGLTKGQFSPTADVGSKLKSGVANDLPPVDLCSLAIELGCGFVARSFSADRKQLLQILKAAVAHRGLAFLDVISPCVTFNDHPGSTKSYDYGREHQEAVNEIGFVPSWEHAEREVDVPPGEAIDVEMPNGGTIKVRKVREDFDPRDRAAALDLLREANVKKEFITGLFYVAPQDQNFLDHLNLVDEPLATLPESRVRPSKAALEQIMAELR